MALPAHLRGSLIGTFAAEMPLQRRHERIPSTMAPASSGRGRA